ncbi:MAG: hypothetical protein ACPGYV_01765 [Phycisphaeraceae bacterium]
MSIVTDSLNHTDAAAAEAAGTEAREQPEAGDRSPRPDDASGERLVPVAEAIRYRKRAQQAEQELEALRGQLDAAQKRCASAEETVTALERRHRIDALLAEADAIDLDAARLLTEAAVQSMDEPDVAEAVEDLRRHKPFLFHPEGAGAGGLALAPEIEGLDDPLAQAAERAQHSGDRRDLLRYLRLRRRP